MSPTNNAAWIDGTGKQLRVGPSELGKPGPEEILVKNHAVAINPVDWKMQDSGYFVQQWPTIFGSDIAGEVVEVGEGVTEVRKGQRILGHALGLVTGKTENAGFQEYTLIPVKATAPIPDSLTYEAAAVIPLALSTAAAGLYQSDFLALPFPSTNAKKNGRTVLIWGGSSSVGSSAIQLAVASGLDVVTTASERNFEYCEKLGAREVFDHQSPSIVSDLTATLKNQELAGVYDAIGLPDSTLKIVDILTKLGGGFIATVQQPQGDLPASVTVKQILAFSIHAQQGGVGIAVYKDFLPAALASGQYKVAPEPEVIGKGLEQLQVGIDKLRKGVSASKLVVTL